MNIVDSSAWLEYFADGPNAGMFSSPLQNIDNLLVPTVCIYEVFKAVLAQRGEDEAIQAYALMKQGSVMDLTPEIAVSASRISIDLQIPMADSIILATARRHNAILWTQDKDFKGIEGVKYFPKKSK